MKWLFVALLTVLLAIQYRLWISRDGVNEVMQAREAVAAQFDENAKLKQRNAQLAAEVRDLKQGFGALEERARSDLGMVRGNETYYQVVPRSDAEAPAPVAPAEEPPTRTAAR
jgi:cell division protein FtsB